MRRKFLPVVAFCLFSSSLTAGPFCPYHWFLYAMAAAEVVRNLAPEHHRTMRAVQGVAFVGFVGFSAKYLLSKLYPEANSEEKKSEK